MFFKGSTTCLLFLSLVCVQIHISHEELSTDVDEAREFLANYGATAKVVYFASYLATWSYSTNITDYNQQKDLEAGLVAAAFDREAYENATKFDETGFPDDIKRQLKKLKDIGSAALEPSKVERYNELTSTMSGNYGSASVCRPDNSNECLQIEPGLGKVMATSEDWEELLWAWQGFRDEVGIPNKPLYREYVALANEASRLNGFSDMGDYWRSEYGGDTIAQAYELYNQILPLYKQLHAYVRRIMNTKHSDHVDLTGRIPGNLLGDMWGRFWGNIYKQVVPYQDAPNIDATDSLRAKNITPLQMFQMGDDFFASCGLSRVNEKFWINSMIEKPTDGRQVVCHPSAWDMQSGDDFRIKMCTEVTMEYFQIIHHELGHTQYGMQYNDLPFLFHDGANGAFHEAVGEVMSLSVSTPAHLSHPDIDLLDAAGTDFGKETDINFLLKTALNTIGTLPFSLALDQWRWDVFAGNVTEDKWMERWWQLKQDLSGVKAPVTRTENDFDPGAKYHFLVDYPFIGYFIRTIIQFQFQKAMCDAAGHTGPLHRCDFYKSQEAGQKLKAMLSLGSSKPWPDAMEAITGQRLMTADAINAYFAPLKTWLEETNEKNGEKIGWETQDPGTDSANSEATMSLFLLLLCLVVATRFIRK
ncbi:angiotensin-converting enzyme-like [Asterias rubens]|uniref:angiotensin-converting enzyme-like n=1 Tax=Asterias rubens TaxID=7604 RepID=UPI0014558BF4|nr:angiotensin-converting enzyme-like [Asterias rubens]